MRLEVHGNDGVLLRDARSARWLLLLLALGFAVTTVVLWHQHDRAGALLVGIVLSLLLVFGAVAGVVNRTEIEIDRRRIRHDRRRLFGSSLQEADRSALSHVELTSDIVVSSHNDSTTSHTVYEVHLAFRHPDLPASVRVLQTTKEQVAQRFARQLCRGVDAPLHDQLGEEPDVRTPATLDRPPSERCADPVGPPPLGLHIAADDRGQLVATSDLMPPARRFVMPFAAVGATFAFGIAGIVVTPSAGERMATAIWTLLGFGAVMLHVLFVWIAFARIHVHVRDGRLHRVSQLFGVPVRRRQVDVRSIHRVRVQGTHGAAANLQPGVAIVGEHGSLMVGQALTADGRRWLAAWLESQLWPSLPVARATAHS